MCIRDSVRAGEYKTITEPQKPAERLTEGLEGQQAKKLYLDTQREREDRQQGQIYNGYISIHEWLSIRYNIDQTQLQQAQLQYRTLAAYVTDAIFAEDVSRYIAVSYTHLDVYKRQFKGWGI